MRLEVNVTYRCNAVCQDCNRAVGLARFPNTDLTAPQMHKAVDALLERRIAVRRLTLAGGEPMLNRQLQGILDACNTIPDLVNARLLTNDLQKPKQPLSLGAFRWVRAPLDDPADAKSGKSKHMPYFVSPQDHGMEARFEWCRVKGYCGKGFDACGFSMCGIAGTLGRLLRINPYKQEPNWEETPDICRHCMYGLSSRKQQQVLFRKAGDANISETYVRAFAEYAENPLEFDRWGEQ